MNLTDLGYSGFFQQQFASVGVSDAIPARVACEHARMCEVLCAHGGLLAEPSGRLRHSAVSRADLPAVGDWVAITPRLGERAATIHAVLPRRSRFSRAIAGSTTQEQIVAANIDTLFLVSGLDANFNARRIERYVAAAYESGAAPAVVLNKADVHPDPQGALEEVRSLAPGVPAYCVSARTGEGLKELRVHLAPGKTIALTGSSGVGKSTLINALLGQDVLETRDISDPRAARGRHTTTSRQLILLPDGGGILIDTPGMRSLAVWSPEPEDGADASRALSHGFEDVEDLVLRCRFSDCTHTKEPGCVVRLALEQGALSPERFENYLKLQRELAHQARRQDQRLQSQEKARWRKISLHVREHMRRKYGYD